MARRRCARQGGAQSRHGEGEPAGGGAERARARGRQRKQMRGAGRAQGGAQGRPAGGETQRDRSAAGAANRMSASVAERGSTETPMAARVMVVVPDAEAHPPDRGFARLSRPPASGRCSSACSTIRRTAPRSTARTTGSRCVGSRTPRTTGGRRCRPYCGSGSSVAGVCMGIDAAGDGRGDSALARGGRATRAAGARRPRGVPSAARRASRLPPRRAAAGRAIDLPGARRR